VRQVFRGTGHSEGGETGAAHWAAFALGLSISRPHLPPAPDIQDPGEKPNEEQGALSTSHTAWEGSSTQGWNEKS